MAAVVASVAAWEGGLLGFLVGAVSVLLFYLVITTIDREEPSLTALVKIAPHITAIATLWFGSWAGGRAVSGVDWKNARVWYLGSLAAMTALFVVPLLAILGYKLGKRMLGSP